MVVAFSCTKNWYQYLLVDIFALLSNNDVEKIYLFIEDSYIDELDLLKKKFKTDFICKNIYECFYKYINDKSPNINSKYSKCSMTRLFFSKEINEDKILYLDVDTLVLSNISDLWTKDIQENYVAGVLDTNLLIFGGFYLSFLRNGDFSHTDNIFINSGVLLMNLKKIRDDKIDDKWLGMINSERLLMPDQDVINSICKGKISVLPDEYNASTCTRLPENKEDIKIMHYNMPKTNWVKNHRYSEIWYEWEDLYNIFKKDNY